MLANIKNTNNNNTLVSYAYDQAGNRLRKRSYNNSGVPVTNTYYVRDAAGTVMSIYEQDIIAATTTQTELPVYGMGTIGIIKTGISSGNRTKLKDLYSLSDHLGNIRLVLEDRLNAFGQPVVAQYADYYPFGSLMPGRSLNPSNYRYSYQNQEKDNETGYHNFELRQYASLLGRWMTPDPYGQHYSPYLAMSNNPVSFIDPDGGEDGSAVDDGGGDPITRHNEAVANRAAQQMNEAYTQWLGEMNNGNVPWYGLSGSMGGYTAGGQKINMLDMMREAGILYNQNKGFTVDSDGSIHGTYIRTQKITSYQINPKGDDIDLETHKLYNGYMGDINVNLIALEPSYSNINNVYFSSGLQGGQSGGGGLSGTDKAGYGLNAFGFANGAKTEIIDYAVRSGSSEAGIRAELQVLGKTGTRYLSAAKGLGLMAGVAGVAVTGIDAYNKGQWQNHHTADFLIGVGSIYLLTGPVGWAVGGGYFLLDVGIKSYTGKSITENLFDKP